ncbi:Gcd10p family-domain-containing protein [Melampsora americana]|nr:Gcd10p family-domain-containing protein [Melampsora americana]
MNETNSLKRAREICKGDHLLLKLPSGLIKPVRNITPNSTISLGKFGTFESNELLGEPYGLTYEIEKSKLIKLIHQTDQSSTNTILMEKCNVEDILATNENIKESDGAQRMTGEEIEELKRLGLSGREIIQRQISQHTAFELKSEFSKEKYIKRKEKKFLKRFMCIEPTINNITQYLFESNVMAIRGLRPDTLSQMLNLANVRPGWKGIVIDDIGGLLVGAVIERLGGSGSILVINDADSPPDLHFLSLLNFSTHSINSIKSLNWAQIESDWSSRETREVIQMVDQIKPIESNQIPPNPIEDSNLKDEKEDVKATESALIGCVDSMSGKDEGSQAQRLMKSKKEMNRLSKKWEKYREVIETREWFFEGEFEGLIVCSEYEPMSILNKLKSRLSGSASIVIQSGYLSTLSNVQHILRNSPDFIHVTISEPWLRRYQVLPGRTHPEMNGTLGGGFVLSAIRVIESGDQTKEDQPKKKIRV